MGNKHAKSTNILNNMDNNSNNHSTKFSLKRRLTNSKYSSSGNMNKSTSTMNLNRSSTSPVIAKWRFSTVVTNDENSSPRQPPTPVNQKLKPVQLDSSPMSNLKSSNNRVLDLNRQLKSNQQNLTNAIKTINQQQQSPYHANSKLYKPNSSLLMATNVNSSNQPPVNHNHQNHHQQKQLQHQHELLNKNMYPSSNNSNKSLQQHMNQKSLQQHPPPQKNVCKFQSNNSIIANNSSFDVNCCKSSLNSVSENNNKNNNSQLRKVKSKSNFSLTAAKLIGNLSPKIKRKLFETFTCHSTSVKNNANTFNNNIKYNTIGRSTLQSTPDNDVNNFKMTNSSIRIKSKSSNNILNVNSRSNKNNLNNNKLVKKVI
jgi:hypothetical protein